MSNSPNKITLNVVVNGQPTEVEANINSPLHTVIEHALQQSGNSGQPPQNWELRDGAGNILDGSRKLSEFNLTSGSSVFLNLKAGVGG